MSSTNPGSAALALRPPATASFFTAPIKSSLTSSNTLGPVKVRGGSDGGAGVQLFSQPF